MPWPSSRVPSSRIRRAVAGFCCQPVMAGLQGFPGRAVEQEKSCNFSCPRSEASGRCRLRALPRRRPAQAQVAHRRYCTIWGATCVTPRTWRAAMRDEISDGYKAALKAGDKRRTATLRAINAAIKDKDIKARGLGKGPLADADVLALLQKMVKQREESLGIYEKAGREDLAVVEREEIAILGEFLPKGLSEAEVDAAIKAAIEKTG